MLAVEWKPGAPPPGHWPRARKRKAAAKAGGGTVADGGATGAGGGSGGGGSGGGGGGSGSGGGGGSGGSGGGGSGGGGGGDGVCGRERHGVVRLFAFGKEAARRKVRGSVDWEAGLDWFVA